MSFGAGLTVVSLSRYGKVLTEFVLIVVSKSCHSLRCAGAAGWFHALLGTENLPIDFIIITTPPFHSSQALADSQPATPHPIHHPNQQFAGQTFTSAPYPSKGRYSLS